MIKAIFFATFDINEGPKLHHLLPQPLPGQPPLFEFKLVAPYLIPPPALCNKPLNILTPTHRKRQPSSAPQGNYRILSHPVCISSEAYPRNAFTFNFGLVLDAHTEFSSYLPVVKKLATLFRGLEEQARFLSKDLAASTNIAVPNSLPQHREQHDVRNRDSFSDSSDDDQPDEDVPNHTVDVTITNETPNTTNTTPRPPRYNTTTKLYALTEILLEDLNNYGETQIPLDATNTLNLKLFPTYPPPPPLSAWHVPLATVPLTILLSPGSTTTTTTTPSSPGAGAGLDLTMARILPHIDGVNSCKSIAQLADADFNLVRKALRHLLYYNCCILLDVFSFGAVYAPTAEIGRFVDNEGGWQEEGVGYVSLPDFAGGRTTTPTAATDAKKHAGTTASETAGVEPLTPAHLTHLYLSLRQGLTVKAFAQEHPDVSSQIDLRRFITFGVIKGFLYRVHRYAFVVPSPTSTSISISSSKKKMDRVKKGRREESDTAAADRDRGKGDGDGDGDKKLAKFLDGQHCFDEICTELEISERELVGRLRGWGGGEVCVICR